MQSQKGGSRTDTLIKLVLIFFISLLSFSVGTYVGKQVSDSDHRRAQIEGDYQPVAEHKEEAADMEATNTTPQDKLSDQDIASLTDEFVSQEKEATDSAETKTELGTKREVASEAQDDNNGYKKYHPGMPDPTEATAKPASDHAEHAAPATAKPAATDHAEHAAAAPATAKPADTKPAHTEPSPAAARVAEGHAPSPDPKEARKPMSILPSVASTAVGKFTVQVASYPDENEAKTKAADLKAKGWNAFYIPADVQGKTWYRVSVGLFTSAKSAADFRSEFQKEAKVTTAIVQKIVK